MADTATPTAAASSPKKAAKAAAASKKPRAKPAHPKTSDMVNNAIKNLKERGGSSLQAIKKYIASNYKVDAERLAPFIRKHLKAAVAAGTLVQTKGKGASGSFKLAKKDTEKPKPPAKKKPAVAAAPKKAPAKEKKPKAAAEKKKPAAKKAPTPAAKKAVAAKKKPATEGAAKKPKSPSKAKKAKAPAAKKPKPKKAVAKKSSPKKAAPKKK